MARRQGWRLYGIAAALWISAVVAVGTRQANGDDGVWDEHPVLADELALLLQPADIAQPPQPEPPAEPPAEPPRVEPPPVPPRRTLARYRPSRFRLASVPNMFGDTLPPGGQMMVTGPGPGSLSARADFPLAGGARRIKVAENNKALPMDRVFFTYNHFENALDASHGTVFAPATVVTSGPVDRYVLGVEKTFGNENWSIDVRMPFVSRFNFSQPAPPFTLSGGEIGNLHATVKALLYATDDWAVAAGLGIDVPTGSDVSGAGAGTTFAVQNEAVHLMPFLGLVGTAREDWFYHGFLEVGVPLNGNTVVVGAGTGTLTEQTVLNLDFSVGRWLVRRPAACLLTGVAAVAELHYTTTLSEIDQVTIAIPGVYTYTFSSAANRMDIANLTVGLHAELAGNTTLRVGGVFPLTDQSNRLFDAELAIQLNRYF